MLDLFEKAKKNQYGIGAFNFSTMEQLKAIVQAASKLKAPVILSTSEGESSFMGKDQARALISSWRRKTGLPFNLHLDHGKSFSSIKAAIEAGYDSVHFDGSGLSYKENLEMTRQIVSWVKKYDIPVEGEIGYLKGGSSLHKKNIKITKEDLTDPREALKFVKQTGVDSLAIAVGNIHGINLKRKNPDLYLDRLEEINKKVGGIAYLVLHGGSGISQSDIKEGINRGIVKINVNTELRVAYTYALKNSLKENKDETTPYKIMPAAVAAVQDVVEEKIKLFGSNDRLP